MSKLLVTGGLGDAFAVESHLAELPDQILLATPRANEIGTCFRQLGCQVEVLSQDRVYYNIHQVEAKHGPLIDVEDGSIERTFHLIRDGKMPFRGSRLLELPLPRPMEEDFVVLQPATQNYPATRSLSQAECLWVANQAAPLPVIVIYKGQYALPAHPSFRNLMNKTSILESIAYIKHAKAFYGCDSCWSVLAAQMKYPCHIRSQQEHWYRWKKVYAAPYHRDIHISTALDGRKTILHSLMNHA